MEKLVRVPFDLETAKKITSGEIEGRIITRNGDQARIICWGRKAPDFPIVALISGDGEEESCEYYRDNGKWDRHGDHNLDLMLEVPEYMTFKDGDVVAFYGCDMVAILQGECGKTENGEYFCKTYVVTNSKNKAVFLKLPIITNEARKATEEEKQKLIAALKASTEPQAKEYLKRFFDIEEKPEHEFKPFDRVLVRDEIYDEWIAVIYSHSSNRDNYPYVASGNGWKQCIPYEGYEHLLGTNNNPE